MRYFIVYTLSLRLASCFIISTIVYFVYLNCSVFFFISYNLLPFAAFASLATLTCFPMILILLLLAAKFLWHLNHVFCHLWHILITFFHLSNNAVSFCQHVHDQTTLFRSAVVNNFDKLLFLLFESIHELNDCKICVLQLALILPQLCLYDLYSFRILYFHCPSLCPSRRLCLTWPWLPLNLSFPSLHLMLHATWLSFLRVHVKTFIKYKWRSHFVAALVFNFVGYM